MQLIKCILRIICVCLMLHIVYGQPERSYTSTININDQSLDIRDSTFCRNNITAKQFQSMIVVSKNGGETVYVGATNNVLQLSSALVFEAKYVSEPTIEDPLGNCLTPPQCPNAECPNGVCTDTYNKFLVAYRDRIIACGTAYKTCNLLMATNVSNEFMPEDDRIHCHSTNSFVSIREQEPPLVATVFVNKGEIDEDLLYVGVSGDRPDINTYLAPSFSNPFFSRIDSTEVYTEHNNVIASTYIYAWSTDSNAYILSRYRDHTGFHTKLVRLCHMFIAPSTRPVDDNDRDTIGDTLGKTSYTQIDIRCNVNGFLYENAIHAEFAFNNLFILFQRDNQYVICSQSFAVLNDDINFARRACLNQSSTTLAEYLDGRSCGPAIRNLENIEVTCAYRQVISEFLSAIAITNPIEMSLQLKYSIISPNEIPTTFVIGKTNEIYAAFIGTSNGRIIKAALEGMNASISEIIVLDRSNPVLKDMVLSEDGDNVFSITDSGVFKINAASCETQYPSCDSCVASRDPYCGWCVYEYKCTMKSECSGFESDQRWIQSTRSIDQCPVISIVQPNFISYQSTETIVLTLEGSKLLANLPLNYHCEFIGNDNTIVSPPSAINGVVTNSPSCTFDSITDEAIIPPGYDHVNVTLGLTYDNVRVAEGSFQVFDCSVIGDINQYMMCTSCTSSIWPCSWCLGSNTCSSNNCRLGSTELSNSSSCPLLTGIAYPLQPISVGGNHAIQINTYRIPTEQTYTCWFDVCGSTTSSSVVVNVSSGILSCTILASQLKCPDSSFELTVSVRSGDYVIDKMPGRSMTVTVFNCSTESVDCGRCVYLNSKFPDCVWCSESTECTPMSACAGDSVMSIGQCSPPLIESIYPLSGPIEGGTVVVINGQNLGTQYSDITSVRIGDLNCVVQPAFYQPSLRIQCLTEPFGRPISNAISVDTNFTNVTAMSSEVFSYKVVRATGYSPAVVLNGSTILVYGDNLNVGGPAQITLTGESSGNYTTTCFNRNFVTMQCRLPFVSQISTFNVSVQIDLFTASLNVIAFVQLPNVTIEQPILGFQSAGGQISIRLSSLDGVQFANLQVGQGELTSCSVERTTKSVFCFLSPASVTMASQRKKREVSNDVSTSTSTSASLIINGLHRFLLGPVTYVSDPEISPLLNELPCSSAPADDGDTALQNITQTSTLNGLTGTIEIRGSNFDATGAVESDFEVTLTPTENEDPITCVVFHLDSNSLFCQASSSLLAQRERQNLLVTVRVFNFTLQREVMYCTGSNITIAIAVSVSITTVLIFIILFLVLRHRRGKKKQQKETKMILTKLDDLENRTRETARKAYYELQVGYMTNLTDNISDRITYLLPSHYFAQTLFNERSGHPVLDHLALHHISSSQKSIYLDWIKLLKRKEFLLTFVGTLEEQRKFTVQEKGKVASLLTTCLFSDLVYLTRIMMELLSRLIQKHVAKNPKLLLRRSESVVEKLVSHWLSITLYEDCITERAGKPLFLLTKAIHYLVSSAPCDIMANKAFNSLNEMTLLGSEIDYTTISLQASVVDKNTGEATPFTEIKVVNVDTITQAKTKIIEAVYKDRPYSECPQPDDLEFKLLPGEEDKKGIILSDIDNVSVSEGNYTKINTIKHYNVPDKAKVILSSIDYMNTETNVGGFRQFLDRNYSFSANEAYDCNRSNVYERVSQDSKVPLLSSRKLYHLIRTEHETEGDDANALLDNFIKKPFEEIYLTRMVKSKSTLQEYVDGVFNSILRPQPIPRAVRYFFQFLDREAIKHKINDPEVIHIWKTNSLLLRYWVNILKNPEFLFDTNKTAIVDSCLNVITQAFMDACTTTSRKLGQDSPSNKLLYAKDAEQYKSMVKEFFVDISNTPEIPENGIDDMLQQQSKEYAGNFNELVAAQQLFEYLEKYREEVIEALKSDNQHSLVNSVEILTGDNRVTGTTVV